VKWGLLQIFAALIEQSESDNSINQKEMSNIYIWLLGLRLPEQESDCYVLSGPEMDAVIDSCIDDIQSGIEFINSEPEWQSMSLIAVAKLNASALIRWGSALVILLMCFTGLRRQSVLNLKLGDWIELRPEVYAIAWKHGKNNYDRVAVLPEVLAKMLNDYVRYLEEPRRALNTDRVFLASDDRGAFCESDGQKLLFNAMANFVKRHKITRGSDPIKLSASILRRTYTTRALSDGRDIWLLRLQLGHKSIKTTMRYAKFERLEHPRQVSDALNTWGRNVLAFWKKPVLLDKLTNEERLHLLNEGESRHVKGGRCRHAGCIKIIAGSPPPCTQCEHLVTGPEFLPEWDIIHVEREKEIKQLKLDDPNGHLLAQKIFQFELFKSNYQYVVGAGVKGVTE
jgi:integrase